MYHKVTLIGNLGKTPELNTTASGQTVCNFPVASTRKWQDNNREHHEETTWFRISVWGKQAIQCAENLTKGSLIFCEGRLSNPQIRHEKVILEVTAHEVKFLNIKENFEVEA